MVEQWDQVSAMLAAKLPGAAELMAKASEDVLAFRHFPPLYRTKVWSIKLLERINEDMKRRTSVVGIFPNERPDLGGSDRDLQNHGAPLAVDLLGPTPPAEASSLRGSLRPQALHRSHLCGEGRRHRRAVSEPAGQGDGALRRREGGVAIGNWRGPRAAEPRFRCEPLTSNQSSKMTTNNSDSQKFRAFTGGNINARLKGFPDKVASKSLEVHWTDKQLIETTKSIKSIRRPQNFYAEISKH